MTEAKAAGKDETTRREDEMTGEGQRGEDDVEGARRGIGSIQKQREREERRGASEGVNCRSDGLIFFRRGWPHRSRFCPTLIYKKYI
jgi:hypothetical protein